MCALRTRLVRRYALRQRFEFCIGWDKMFNYSVLKTTGQWWKAVLSFVSILGGGALMYYGLSHSSAIVPILSGIVVVALGFVFACTAIRCPLCRARWVWLGVNGQNSRQWLAWLLMQTEC